MGWGGGGSGKEGFDGMGVRGGVKGEGGGRGRGVGGGGGGGNHVRMQMEPQEVTF